MEIRELMYLPIGLQAPIMTELDQSNDNATEIDSVGKS